MPPADENIELRSPKVRNIIGKIPPAIIRYGNTVVFFVIAGLIVAGYLFKYPDIKTTPAIIYQLNGNLYANIYLPAGIDTHPNLMQNIQLNTSAISNLKNERMNIIADSISSYTVILNNTAYKILYAKVPVTNIYVEDTAKITATIFLGYKRPIEKLTNSYNFIFNKSKR